MKNIDTNSNLKINLKEKIIPKENLYTKIKLPRGKKKKSEEDRSST